MAWPAEAHMVTVRLAAACVVAFFAFMAVGFTAGLVQQLLMRDTVCVVLKTRAGELPACMDADNVPEEAYWW